MEPNPPSDTTWRWPRLNPRVALVLLAIYGGMGLWRGVTEILDQRASGAERLWAQPLVWEMTSHLWIWLLLPLGQTVALNARWNRGRRLRSLGVFVAGAGLYWIIHVAGMWASRLVIYRMAGWGWYDYGITTYRVSMEGFKDVLGFLSMVLAFQAWTIWQEKQARELAVARLETELREARLQALAAQLDPHFLFNSLNTLSSVMYEDVAKADSLLSDLGLMLRDTLQAEGAMWPLAREQAYLEHYLGFVRARFGDRVQVALDLAPGLGATPVPRFALQRLVENALKHNEGEVGRMLHIQVTARASADLLHLEVRDDGVGFPLGAGQGVGLSNLARTLSLLHGDRASLEAATGPQGGAHVSLHLPLAATHG